MEPESMVYALEQIHALLEAGGYLIDIHPRGELVKFIRLQEGQEQFIGHMQETDNYIEYRQADEALEAVVSKGLFQVEKKMEFIFNTYADSFDNLRIFLDENWSDAVVPEDVIATARRLDEEHGERTVLLHEKTGIMVLKKN